MKMKRRPTYFMDHNSKRCVRVPLANSKLFAELYAEDFERLCAQGVTTNWHLSRGARGIGYPAVSLKGYNTQFIARLIAGAPHGKQVSYRDRNRLNLKGDNLVLSRCRHARNSSRDALESLTLRAEDARDAA